MAARCLKVKVNLSTPTIVYILFKIPFHLNLKSTTVFIFTCIEIVIAIVAETAYRVLMLVWSFCTSRETGCLHAFDTNVRI